MAAIPGFPQPYRYPSNEPVGDYWHGPERSEPQNEINEINAFDDAWVRFKTLKSDVDKVHSHFQHHQKEVHGELRYLREQLARCSHATSQVNKLTDQVYGLEVSASKASKFHIDFATWRDNELPNHLTLNLDSVRDELAKVSGKVASLLKEVPKVESEVSRMREDTRGTNSLMAKFQVELESLRNHGCFGNPDSNEIEKIKGKVAVLINNDRTMKDELANIKNQPDPNSEKHRITRELAELHEEVHCMHAAMGKVVLDVRQLQKQTPEFGNILEECQLMKNQVNVLCASQYRLEQDRSNQGFCAEEGYDVSTFKNSLKKQAKACDRLHDEVRKLSVQAAVSVNLTGELDDLKQKVNIIRHQFENDVGGHLDAFQEDVLQKQVKFQNEMRRAMKDLSSSITVVPTKTRRVRGRGVEYAVEDNDCQNRHHSTHVQESSPTLGGFRPGDAESGRTLSHSGSEVHVKRTVGGDLHEDVYYLRQKVDDIERRFREGSVCGENPCDQHADSRFVQDLAVKLDHVSYDQTRSRTEITRLNQRVEDMYSHMDTDVPSRYYNAPDRQDVSYPARPITVTGPPSQRYPAAGPNNGVMTTFSRPPSLGRPGLE